MTTMASLDDSKTTTAALPTMLLILTAISAVASGFDTACSSLAAIESRSSGTSLYGGSWRRASTRLRFGNDENNSNATLLADNQRRWRNPFAADRSHSARTGTLGYNSGANTDGSVSDEEQAKYLEFLDRRYRRLHSDEEEERQQLKRSLQQQQPQSKTFSALDWLYNGSGSGGSSITVTNTREEQENAMYVLGVAGLASKEVLQREAEAAAAARSNNYYHAPTPIETASPLEQQDAVVIDYDDDFPISQQLRPFVEALRLVQRRKVLAERAIQRLALSSFARVANAVIVRPVSRGPAFVVSSLLEACGGKRNILRTISWAYAAFLLFRPLLQGAVSEVASPLNP